MKIAVTSILLSLSLALGCSGPEESASSSSGEPLVGGKADPGHPAVGMVQQIGSNGHVSCTGTLIGPRTVLTAEHCVDGGPAAWFQLERVPASLNDVYYSKKLVLHQTLDLALVLLNDHPQDRSTPGSPRPLKPMGIVTASQGPKIGMAITLVGFGRTEHNTPADGVKRLGTNKVTIVQGDQYWFYGPANVCFGDSGGPSITTAYGGDKVIGVHSLVAGTCGYGGSDARVDAAFNWICANTNDVAACAPPPPPPPPKPDLGLPPPPPPPPPAPDQGVAQALCKTHNDCDDGNPCTLDVCRPTQGCVHWNNCGDGSVTKPRADAGAPKPRADAGVPKPKPSFCMKVVIRALQLSAQHPLCI